MEITNIIPIGFNRVFDDTPLDIQKYLKYIPHAVAVRYVLLMANYTAEENVFDQINTLGLNKYIPLQVLNRLTESHFPNCRYDINSKIDISKNQDYTYFKVYPFIILSDTEYGVINNIFTSNIIYNKLKFYIRDICSDYKICDFFSSFNNDFIEKYLFIQILKYSFSALNFMCLSESDCPKYFNNTSKKELESLPDGYVRCQNKILLFECKGKIISIPAIGWIRGNTPANEETLQEINELRKEVDELRKYKQEKESYNCEIEDIESLDEKISFSGTHGTSHYQWETILSWKDLFGLISPYFLKPQNYYYAKEIISKVLVEETGRSHAYHPEICSKDFQTIKIQMRVLGLMYIAPAQTTKGGQALFWSLSKKGVRLMNNLRVIRHSETFANNDK